MTRAFNEAARRHAAYYPEDAPGFQRAARTLQSIWRQRMNLPMGNQYGSELQEAPAMEHLSNYLTPGIRKVVADELHLAAASGKLYGKPRIYTNLLSSQPLCFNLFGELKLDPGLATRVLNGLYPGRIAKVTGIQFEYSPERSSQRFTDDRSAFDVFVDYDAADGGRGFLGIEVKYHEDLTDKVATHRDRYDEVARMMNCFSAEGLPALQKAPLQQLWRDHLLAGSMLNDKELGYTEGMFVVMYPAANTPCRRAVRAYRRCLLSDSTFDSCTLDEMVGVLSLATSSAWVGEFHDRYLDFRGLESFGV